MEILSDLPALVTMLARLFRLIVGFPEGMFGITDGFTDDFQRFGHSLIPLVLIKG
jgi:hypothetical protein